MFVLIGGGVLIALGTAATDFAGASSGKILALVGIAVILVILICCALLAGLTMRLSRWLLERYIKADDGEG